MEADSDEHIWRQVLAGDAAAFGLIWDRHRDRVFRHLIASGSSAEAEDIAAITFLELWRRRRSVRFVDQSLLPWLIVTARNVARNQARARRRHQTFLHSLPPPAVTPDHAERIADLDDTRLRVLREAVAAAKPSDSHLLAMTVLDGFSIAEAAAAMGISESAAKMRLSRFRGNLRATVSMQSSEGGS